MSRQIKYLSLFSGIGGFELGIQQAYEDLSNSSREQQGWVSYDSSNNEQSLLGKEQPACIGFSEIDKYAVQIYQSHFPEHKNYGDITRLNTADLPDFDLLVGGFPCQAFSIAGKRKGFEDTRGTLFFEIARILRDKQPRLFLLENVKGLLSHDNGNTFKTIISTLDELGYDLQWQVLNSKNFGVPQNRERVFIVGHLRGTSRPQVFPLTGNDAENTGQRARAAGINNPSRGYEIRKDGLASSLRATEMGSKNFIADIRQLNNPTHSNDRVYASDGISPTLNTMQGGNRQPFVAIPEATKKGYAEATVGQAINLAVPNSKTRRGRVSDVAQTLDTGMQQYTLTEDVRIRRLTPTECERLQGFPDGWTEYGGFRKATDITNKNPEHLPAFEKISDTQRYKTLGNAVTVNVIREIVKHLL